MADNSNWNTDPAENVEIDGALVDDGVSESWSLVRAVKSIMAALGAGAFPAFRAVHVVGGMDYGLITGTDTAAEDWGGVDSRWYTSRDYGSVSAASISNTDWGALS